MDDMFLAELVKFVFPLGTAPYRGHVYILKHD